MESEKLQILKMVQDGTVSAEEGSKLLQALEQKGAVGSAGGQAKWMRIRVKEKNGNLVNVNLPLSLMEVAVNMGMKFIPKEEMPDIDIPMLLEAIRQGLTGKVVEVVSEDVTVDIVVE